jgi:hypothetical protein
MLLHIHLGMLKQVAFRRKRYKWYHWRAQPNSVEKIVACYHIFNPKLLLENDGWTELCTTIVYYLRTVGGHQNLQP